jgi:hypothetical protein
MFFDEGTHHAKLYIDGFSRSKLIHKRGFSEGVLYIDIVRQKEPGVEY